MPWCPNCKSEYQDGYEICSDCNVSLIENLEVELEEQATSELIDMDSLESTEKLIDFLNYSKIRKVSCEFFEETNTWKVSVLKEDTKEALKLLKAFLIAEQEEKEKEIPAEKEATTSKNTSAYIKKTDKYNDFKSSVVIFIPFGVIGLLVVLLNIMGVLHFLTSTFQIIILSVCFIAFIYVGLHSLFQLKKIREEIEQENTETTAIIDWLKENVTMDILSHNINEEDTDEIRYIKQTNLLKNMILDEFHDIDESFIDQLIEDYYNEYIDSDIND